MQRQKVMITIRPLDIGLGLRSKGSHQDIKAEVATQREEERIKIG